MSYSFYHILHIFCLFFLVAITFAAILNPEDNSRKKTLMLSGIASLIIFVSGFGLVAKAGTGFPFWLIVKMICWLAISSIAGIAYKKKELSQFLKTSLFVLVGLAIIMVSLKPF